MQTVIAVFNEKNDAESAINELQTEGYNPKNMSIVMKDAREGKELAHNTGADVAGATMSGVTTGAALGGIAGLLAGIVIPGLGAFLIGGPIAAALGLTGVAASTVSGVATGAVAGGLVGLLTGMGVSEDDAKMYESHINQGAILIAVPARTNEEEFVAGILGDNGATQIRTVTADREESRSRSYNDDSMSQSYAQMGAKGGRSRSSKQGKGWHNDPEDHARAAKGEEIE